jgi:hypothetical protein
MAKLGRDFNSRRFDARLQLEYAKIEESLRAWGVRSTIIVFGGRQIHEDETGVGPPRPSFIFQMTPLSGTTKA